MAHSMTAFARTSEAEPWGNAIWEIRSVNHRFLDVMFRLPDNFRALEYNLRDCIRNKIQRGKIECSLRCEFNSTDTKALRVNRNLVQALHSASQEIAEMIPNLAQGSAYEWLSWPGVVEAEPLDLSLLNTALTRHFQTTLDQLIAVRAHEGESLSKHIFSRLQAINQEVDKIKQTLPHQIKRHRERMQQVLSELHSPLDPARVEQEIALLANKADIAEEVDRLLLHVEEVRRVLKQEEGVGRRLDFLMQEMNREANTLSAKALDHSITQSGVEIKVLIEQMREQIQNLE